MRSNRSLGRTCYLSSLRRTFLTKFPLAFFLPSFWSNLKYCVISQIKVLPSTASELSENGQNAEEHWREMENTSKLRNNILILHVLRVTFLPACDTKKLSSHLYTTEESWVRIFFIRTPIEINFSTKETMGDKVDNT